VFSLVIMTEPYASHDASEIEPALKEKHVGSKTRDSVMCNGPDYKEEKDNVIGCRCTNVPM
jgi:hypothetical protein